MVNFIVRCCSVVYCVCYGVMYCTDFNAFYCVIKWYG